MSSIIGHRCCCVFLHRAFPIAYWEKRVMVFLMSVAGWGSTSCSYSLVGDPEDLSGFTTFELSRYGAFHSACLRTGSVYKAEIIREGEDVYNLSLTFLGEATPPLGFDEELYCESEDALLFSSEEGLSCVSIVEIPRRQLAPGEVEQLRTLFESFPLGPQDQLACLTHDPPTAVPRCVRAWFRWDDLRASDWPCNLVQVRTVFPNDSAALVGFIETLAGQPR